MAILKYRWLSEAMKHIPSSDSRARRRAGFLTESREKKGKKGERERLAAWFMNHARNYDRSARHAVGVLQMTGRPIVMRVREACVNVAAWLEFPISRWNMRLCNTLEIASDINTAREFRVYFYASSLLRVQSSRGRERERSKLLSPPGTHPRILHRHPVTVHHSAKRNIIFLYAARFFRRHNLQHKSPTWPKFLIARGNSVSSEYIPPDILKRGKRGHTIFIHENHVLTMTDFSLFNYTRASLTSNFIQRQAISFDDQHVKNEDISQPRIFLFSPCRTSFHHLQASPEYQ